MVDGLRGKIGVGSLGEKLGQCTCDGHRGALLVGKVTALSHGGAMGGNAGSKRSFLTPAPPGVDSAPMSFDLSEDPGAFQASARAFAAAEMAPHAGEDRKSTSLNSSH